MASGPDRKEPESECVMPPPAMPSEDLARYSVSRDPHSEADIARYVEGQAADEEVKHVEKIKEEIVAGEEYVIWDVTTDKDRWWVITNLTNLYSQRNFPSLDYTLSFHVGLMMRLRSRPEGADSTDPTPFDEVFRRQEQAKERHDRAVEAEDFQSVGMQLRECLISLVAAMRRAAKISADAEHAEDSNFIAWSSVLMDMLCPGSSNKQLRQHLKNTAKETWQLVNWLTHDRNASEVSASIAIHSCDTVVGHFVQIIHRSKTDTVQQCPLCNSRHIRSHYDPAIEPSGDYYLTCGKCDWTNHPDGQVDA
jgi:hypothetical protein